MKEINNKHQPSNNIFIQNIPNALTCGNIVCGCLGIIQIFKGDLALACYLVFIGALFDFVDGLAARILNAKSPLGKDLDSLADMTTFGVLPGLMMYYIINLTTKNDLIPFIGILIPVFSAIRLAKFNNDPRQASDFFGLPTPANALFFVSIPLIILFDQSGLKAYIMKPLLLSSFVVIFCLLMVSEMKLFSLKIKSFNFKDNIFIIVLFFIANLLFFYLFFTAIPFIIILYIILSLLKTYLKK
jgi:CDP-diacylglycerol--serine O-phosphatidyltransferase